MGSSRASMRCALVLCAVLIGACCAVAPARPCPGCGGEVADTVNFCPECGRDARGTAGLEGGVGAEIRAGDAGIVVVSVLPGGAAERAGVEAGWTIESVDGTTTRGMGVDDAAKVLRGAVGSEVQLGLRSAAGDLKVIAVKRARLVLGLPRAGMAGEGIGLIGLPLLTAETPAGVRAAVAELEKQGARGFIIDLRGSRGGQVQAMEQVAGIFVPKGGVLWVVEMTGEGRHAVKSAGPGDVKAPLVVLIDGATQGSELLASAIKTRHRGVVVGQRSSGTCAVRKVEARADGTAAFKDVGRFMAEPMTGLSGVGVTPDRVMPGEATPEDYLRAGVEELRKAMPERRP